MQYVYSNSSFTLLHNYKKLRVCILKLVKFLLRLHITNNLDIATDNPSTTQEPIEADTIFDPITYHDVEGGVSTNNPLLNKEKETEDIVTISARHCVIYKSKLSELESKAAKYDLIMKQLRSKNTKALSWGMH